MGCGVGALKIGLMKSAPCSRQKATKQIVPANRGLTLHKCVVWRCICWKRWRVTSKKLVDRF